MDGCGKQFGWFYYYSSSFFVLMGVANNFCINGYSTFITIIMDVFSLKTI